MNTKGKILFIINPISGTSRKEDIPGHIMDSLNESKWDITISFTAFPGHASQLTQEAINDNYSAIVAVGGDGTINEVASILASSEVALGIIPCGSGNGLARHLQIPSNIKEALKIIDNAFTTHIDYCTVNETPFFCTCGTGFDAKVSEKFAKSDARGPVTYVRTTINEFLSTSGEHYRITIDGETFDEPKAFSVVCCNAAQYGNNAFIAPNASMQDGLIDLTVIHDMNLVDGPLLAARLLTKQINRDNHVTIYRGKHIVIERDKADIIHIDGDPIMATKNLKIDCIDRGLKVMVKPRF